MKALIEKYTRMRDNVQWHIDTNKPEGNELEGCRDQMRYYNHFLSDLKATPDATEELVKVLEEIIHHIDTWSDEPKRAIRLVRKLASAALDKHRKK